MGDNLEKKLYTPETSVAFSSEEPKIAQRHVFKRFPVLGIDHLVLMFDRLSSKLMGYSRFVPPTTC